jgi:hypothetical protein
MSSHLYILFYFIQGHSSSNSDSLATNERMIGEWWIEKNVEGSGCGVIYGAVSEFARKGWGEPRKTRFFADFLPTKICNTNTTRMLK